MASSKTCLVAVLCSLVILTTFISSAQSASCCLRYSKRQPPCRRILGYTVQNINNSCDINAIVFHIAGRFVCADPSKLWTQKIMKCVDEKRRKSSQIVKKENSDKASA
ncbi:C-C motif chemokine 20b [Archocentrus centrarchus]|uniref:Chemokine interleukin-8-like domain-containing protein n=1 Tax=Amphilophus citrinellus TaxID=61819 RepID=A0A3Q0SZ51_AMPCI|nr:C-C motif chemokine 20-like [Archocentrus centrarchus]